MISNTKYILGAIFTFARSNNFFVESVTWPECVYALCVHVYVCI